MADIVYTPEALTQVAIQSIGKPIKTEQGETLGIVEDAWVEDGRVFAKMKLADELLQARIA